MHFPMWTFEKIIQNGWKQYIYFKFIRICIEFVKEITLNSKVIIDADLHKLCEKIERLTESMNQIVVENNKLQSDITIVKNVNWKLEAKIVYLEKNNNSQMGSNIAAETTWKYQTYQTPFLISILRAQS